MSAEEISKNDDLMDDVAIALELQEQENLIAD